MEQVERNKAGEEDTAQHTQVADDLAAIRRSSKTFLLPLSVFGAMAGLVGHELLQAGPD